MEKQSVHVCPKYEPEEGHFMTNRYFDIETGTYFKRFSDLIFEKSHLWKGSSYSLQLKFWFRFQNILHLRIYNHKNKLATLGYNLSCDNKRVVDLLLCIIM
uniref:Uncharacterized protein n=1 Tax=Cacopsylla melanoneura TaxID=428564 RepID=A0A8D9EAF0_9HEMI